jgi:hypothetical protein
MPDENMPITAVITIEKIAIATRSSIKVKPFLIFLLGKTIKRFLNK